MQNHYRHIEILLIISDMSCESWGYSKLVPPGSAQRVEFWANRTRAMLSGERRAKIVSCGHVLRVMDKVIQPISVSGTQELGVIEPSASLCTAHLCMHRETGVLGPWRTCEFSRSSGCGFVITYGCGERAESGPASMTSSSTQACRQ